MHSHPSTEAKPFQIRTSKQYKHQGAKGLIPEGFVSTEEGDTLPEGCSS
jgi:hypothetical protein